MLKRGLWLIFIELTIVSFGWHFDPQFRNTFLIVIWVLGVSMVVLAGLIHLPKRIILLFSIGLIFGHNLLDGLTLQNSVLWSILHDPGLLFSNGTHTIRVGYTIIPWIAVMSLGYCFGSLYENTFDSLKRKRILNGLGIGSLMLFLVLIAINGYGDPVKWTNFGYTIKTVMSIFNVSKYPPSLMFLLVTLGPAFLFLANAERLKGKIVNFFSVFGSVPFFYYIIHFYLIHFMALFAAEWTGYGWQSMILSNFVTRVEALKGYGFNLLTVYLIWIIVIALLYPLCKKFDTYIQNHKDHWWLSYL